MNYYKFHLQGGTRGQRYEYATEFNLRPSDHTGDQMNFYLAHPATLEQLRRNHCAGGHDFTVEITQVTKEETAYR